MSSVVGVRLRWSAAGLVLVSGLALALACGGQSEGKGGSGDDGGENGGTAGSSTGGGPTGGTAGEGGAGTGASSGVGATSGNAGTSSGGGSSGTSGMAGEGGVSSGGSTSSGGSSSGTSGMAGEGGVSSGAECTTAADCEMVSDCCSCRSEPLTGSPGFCPLDCARDACAEGNIALNEVDCVMGRCVIARSCVGNVLCPALPPNCGEGRLPSVLDGCWGPCLDVTECSAVPGCSSCGDAVCVDSQTLARSFHCVEPAGCNAGSYCECLEVCSAGCSENGNTVSCFCLSC